MPGRSQEHLVEHQGITSAGGKKPVMATLPTFSGTNTVGSQQTGVNGTFEANATATVTITRQWTRNGNPISGATNVTYTLTSQDAGKTIRFTNIGTNRYGRTVIASAGRAVPAE
jgi:hypothetical protein